MYKQKVETSRASQNFNYNDNLYEIQMESSSDDAEEKAAVMHVTNKKCRFSSKRKRQN
jgi:hypothetical protein